MTNNNCMILEISAPATSANLGPGFDCLGAALDIKNVTRIKLTRSNEYSMVHTMKSTVLLEEGCENTAVIIPYGTRDLLVEGCCQVLNLSRLLQSDDSNLIQYCDHEHIIDKDQCKTKIITYI